MICYLNGKYISLKKAGVGLYDVGLLRGFGIFDVLRTYNGKPFLINDHLDRLEKSAEILNLKLPVAKKKIIEITEKLLCQNNFSKNKEAVIRIVLTGGIAEDGVNYDPKNPTFFIITEKFQSLPEKFYQEGIRLITYEYQREFSSAKTINYLAALRLQDLRRKEKVFEVLYTHRKRVLEGTMSNFFILKNNTLITPRGNVLIGITRNAVINLAEKNFKVIEKNIITSDLKLADEAFITATNKDIIPVVRINDLVIGDGKVGRKTKLLMESFHEYTGSI